MRKVISGFAALLCLGMVSVASGEAQAQAEGQKLYATYCAGCHGDKGKGDGLAAKSLPVRPVDHTDGKLMNQLTDQYLWAIISKGGPAVEKSSFMPGWTGQLNDRQVRELITFIRSIAEPPYPAPKN